MNHLSSGNNRNLEDKARVTLSDRQIKYLAARASGKSKIESVKLAGYGVTVKPCDVENRNGMKRAILNALEVNGITDAYISQRLKEGMDAEKSTFITFKGTVTDELKRPDLENRHKFTKTVLELRGDLQPENQTNVNVGLIEVPRMSKDAEAWNTETEQSDASKSAKVG